MSYQFSPGRGVRAARVAGAAPLQPVTAGRFAETPGTKAVRAVFRVLCAVAPRLAAHLARAELAKPPRFPMRDWQVNMRKQARAHRLPFGKGDIAVYEWGSGPPVLMVHGWGSHAIQMGRMIRPLVNAGFRVVAFDAPAHGESSGRSTDIVQFAAAIAAVARHTGELRALVGHSFGGAMAMYAFRDWGIDAKKVVLISTFNHCNWFLELFRRHVSLSADVLGRAKQLLEDMYGGRFEWSRMSVVDMVRNAAVPGLIIHDEDDEEIPFEHGLSLAHAMPHAEFKATSGYGHHLVVRNLDVIDSVVEFVARRS